GHCRGGRGRREHQRRLGDRGRRRDRRVVPGVHPERADPAEAVAVLAAGDLRPRDPHRGRHRRRAAPRRPALAGPGTATMSRARRFLGWEALLAVVLVALIAIGTTVSPVFLSGRNFTNLTAAVIEVSIMALPMALIIIAGEIDLSVESMAGLSCAIVGILWQAGIPIQVAIPIVLVIGAAGGLLNGVLVTSFGLPSLVVTLGTLALFRGLALVVLGSQGVAGFPDWFTSFGFGTVPGTPIPWPLLIFAALAIVLGTVLHTMWPGRRLFAIGKNASAARYSGVGVARTKLVLFAFNGVIAALAGVIL